MPEILGSLYAEVVCCDSCGQCHAAEELTGGVCPDCVRAARYEPPELSDREYQRVEAAWDYIAFDQWWCGE
jgi:hypothetical protein